MTKTGMINVQIKQKELRKEYFDSVKKSGLSESEFIRLSIRHMISCMKEINGIPTIRNGEK